MAEKLSGELLKAGAAVLVWLEPNGVAAAAASGAAGEPNIDVALVLFATFAAGVGDEKLNADDCWLPNAGGLKLFAVVVVAGCDAGIPKRFEADVVAGAAALDSPNANGVDC